MLHHVCYNRLGICSVVPFSCVKHLNVSTGPVPTCKTKPWLRPSKVTNDGDTKVTND